MNITLLYDLWFARHNSTIPTPYNSFSRSPDICYQINVNNMLLVHWNLMCHFQRLPLWCHRLFGDVVSSACGYKPIVNNLYIDLLLCKYHSTYLLAVCIHILCFCYRNQKLTIMTNEMVIIHQCGMDPNMGWIVSVFTHISYRVLRLVFYMSLPPAYIPCTNNPCALFSACNWHMCV